MKATAAEHPSDAVLTAKELAAALKCSPRQIRRLNIPMFYVGNRSPRYVWGEVIAALNSQARRGAA